MPDLTPEQIAREKIDVMLIAAGWAVQKYRAFNPSSARGVALREVPLASGRCDYLLLVDRKAVDVVEAKKEETTLTLSTVADQSGHYGESLPDFLKTSGVLPFLYESAGVESESPAGNPPPAIDSRTSLLRRTSAGGPTTAKKKNALENG